MLSGLRTESMLRYLSLLEGGSSAEVLFDPQDSNTAVDGFVHPLVDTVGGQGDDAPAGPG